MPAEATLTPSPPNFEVPLSLGAQIEARAEHPQTANKVFLRQAERSWSYRVFRDEWLATNWTAVLTCPNIGLL